MKVLCNFFKNKKIKVISIVLATIMLFVAIMSYLNYVVNPVIITTNEAYIKSLVINAVNSSISQTLTATTYNNLISINYDSNGNITLIQANTLNVNALTTQITSLAQTNLENIGNTGFNVPLGTFSGIAIFNGLGPKINIKIIPIGHINLSYESSFESAGINQTHHKIHLKANAIVSVLLPIKSVNILTSANVLIADSIIVGKVPEVYLNTDNLTNALNLIP